MTERIKCIDLEDVVGKTVKAIVENTDGSNLLIVFNDGSLIQLYADSEDDDADISGCSRFEPGVFRWQVLQDAIGDLYPEIVAEIKTETEFKNAQRVAHNEAEERAQFERLRKKFQGGEA